MTATTSPRQIRIIVLPRHLGLATLAVVLGGAASVGLALLGLATLPNLVVVWTSLAGWLLLGLILEIVDRGFALGLVRGYFYMHLVFVQLGILIIYLASQREALIRRLYLEFSVSPSLSAIYIPLLGMGAYVVGVLLHRAWQGRLTPPVLVQPGRLRTFLVRAFWLFMLAAVYGAVAFLSRGTLPLLQVVAGADAGEVRLAYHYGGASRYLFHASIVSQVYVAIGPMVVLYLMAMARDRRQKAMAAVAGLLLGLFYLNSLERTTFMIAGLWGLLLFYYRYRRLPLGFVLIIGMAFVAISLLIHYTAGAATSIWDVILLQVVRRIAVVNAMVNYFVYENYPGLYGFRLGDTYLDYLGAVAGSGESFARQMMRIIYPGRTVGTAPIGAMAEAWLNFGPGLVLLMLGQGLGFAVIDGALRRRLHYPLGQVFAAGMVVLLSTTSYGSFLSVFFSGGVLFVWATYLVLRVDLTQWVRNRHVTA